MRTGQYNFITHTLLKLYYTFTLCTNDQVRYVFHSSSTCLFIKIIVKKSLISSSNWLNNEIETFCFVQYKTWITIDKLRRYWMPFICTPSWIRRNTKYLWPFLFLDLQSAKMKSKLQKFSILSSVFLSCNFSNQPNLFYPRGSDRKRKQQLPTNLYQNREEKKEYIHYIHLAISKLNSGSRVLKFSQRSARYFLVKLNYFS